MLLPTISVSDAEWQYWIEAAANTLLLRKIEISGELFNSAPELRQNLEDYGLTITHCRDIVPSDVGRYLFESSDPVCEEIARETLLLMNRLWERRVQLMSLEVGLDRIAAKNVEGELGRRVRFLHRLIEAGNDGNTLCVAARNPRNFPTSKAWEYAGNLIHEVGRPHCRLRVDLFPSELPPESSIDKLVSSFYLHAGVIRIHWQPAQGETTETIRAADWIRALVKHGYKGGFVLCPDGVQGQDRVVNICGKLDAFISGLQ